MVIGVESVWFYVDLICRVSLFNTEYLTRSFEANVTVIRSAFRILNIMGNVVLYFGYNPAVAELNPSLGRRLVRVFLAGLVYWTKGTSLSNESTEKSSDSNRPPFWGFTRDSWREMSFCPPTP
jgi:hypothetical protein